MLFRKFISLSEPLPTWLRRGFVALFPRGTRVHTVARIIDTLDVRSREIYADKKRAFEMGDAEIVKQVAQGKDIMSILCGWCYHDLVERMTLIDVWWQWRRMLQQTRRTGCRTTR